MNNDYFVFDLSTERTAGEIGIDAYEMFNKRFQSVARNYIKNLDVWEYYWQCCVDNRSFDDYLKSLKKQKGLIWSLKNSRNADEIQKSMDAYVDDCQTEFYNDFIKSGEMVYCNAEFDNYLDENFMKLLEQMSAVEKYFPREKIDLALTSKCYGFDFKELENINSLTENVGNLEVNAFDIKITLPQLLESHEKEELLINKIKSLDLSPFEQYLLVHDFVAGKPFEFSENTEFDCRNYIHSMISNQIVCVGYAELMSHLCSELGIRCDYIHGRPKSEVVEEYELDSDTGHAFNVVYLVDPKYNLNGFYISDACWDSTLGFNSNSKNYVYAALPIQDMSEDKHRFYYDEVLSTENRKTCLNYPEYAEPIGFDKLKAALDNAYRALDREDFNENVINESLTKTRRICEEQHIKGGEVMKRIEADYPLSQLETKFPEISHTIEADRLPD